MTMVVIFLGGVMSGWPAPWELLPGTFHAAAFESGIDRDNMTAVAWIRDHLPSNQRIGCDVSSYELLGAYTDEHPVDDVQNLFYAPSVTPQVLSIVHRRDIQYLLVDLRLSTQKPITGSFFHETEAQSAENAPPAALSALTKFKGYPGVSLIYAAGPIEIYDLVDLDHA
jgi:hypothetical protein